jgi:NADPH-dependent 2,4-dienoyl-CoA reductase/sulfur reductase-like enzyme
LRTLADSRALIVAATGAGRVVVIGASFIGLEVAASLRARGLAVRVVAPEARPMETVFGPEVGDLVRQVHDEHGVAFHLGTMAASFDPNRVILKSGEPCSQTRPGAVVNLPSMTNRVQIIGPVLPLHTGTETL